MTPPRLTRQGMVLAVAPGCTTFSVGVPCTACQVGSCASRRAAPQLRLAGGSGQAPVDGLAVGDRVELSIASRGLTVLSLRLLGPPLVWILAWISIWSALGGLTPLAATGIGISGLVSALALGRWWGGRGDGLLDVRARSPERPDGLAERSVEEVGRTGRSKRSVEEVGRREGRGPG